MHTVLICDDDRDIVSALDIYLTSEGYRTVCAYNGEEAMTAGILWVLQDEHKKVYLTKGHSESATMTLTTLLGYAGYTVETIDLHNTEVPSDAEMVIISNPVQDFEKAGSVGGLFGKADSRSKIFLCHTTQVAYKADSFSDSHKITS